MYHIVFKYRQVFLSKKTSYYIRVKVRICERPSIYLLDQDLCRCKEKERQREEDEISNLAVIFVFN